MNESLYLEILIGSLKGGDALKLFDLLETAKRTGDIIKNKDQRMGIVYSEKYNCFIWCYMDGRAVETAKDHTGLSRVILTSNIMERDGWYLEPIKNTIPNHPYKTYITANGLVVDSENVCSILKSDGLGNHSIIELNKREGTITNKGNPFCI